MIYEKLVKENVIRAVELARELHALGTFGQEGPEFDWHTMRVSVEMMVDDPTYYVRMAVVDGSYVGVVCGHMAPFIFSPKLMAIEDAWFVREGTSSRAKVAVGLMRGFVEWARGNGAVLIQTGDIAGINSIGVDALYRRIGFERFGINYRYVG